MTIHKTGDVVFAYRDIPVDIAGIKTSAHPVKVGMSDAYIIDRTVFCEYTMWAGQQRGGRAPRLASLGGLLASWSAAADRERLVSSLKMSGGGG